MHRATPHRGRDRARTAAVARAWRARVALTLGLVLALVAAGTRADPDPAKGFATIDAKDLMADLVALASAPLEGRDSPSVGLDRAAEHIIARLSEAGFSGTGEEGSMLWPFTRELPAPVPEGCSLVLTADDGTERPFTYGEDFVPVWRSGGDASGEVVFYAFGIDSDAEKYDDVTGKVAGTVAVILEGEPRHKRKFDGETVTSDAALYSKLEMLEEEGVVGVLVVRRPPEDEDLPRGTEPPEPARLGFRHTWARWAGNAPPRVAGIAIPVLEVTAAVADELTGLDVLGAAAKIDRSGKAPKPSRSGKLVSLSASSEEREITIHNVVGVLKGSDPELADEYVVIGAHFDHVGVDPRGRIGFGADDNASGTAAMLEVASALAAAEPRRSILACAFAAEEDGLLGSKALCDDPPVPKESLVAMINMDMVGRGETDEVAVLGLMENPGFEKLLSRAQKLKSTRVKKIVMRQGQDLFERSDHFSFHKIGVPVLFFFEGLPISKNVDYHTWRDTIDKLDFEKMERTTKLVYNTAYLLAVEDERPPPPN